MPDLVVEHGKFARPEEGVSWKSGPAWQSHGGPTEKHPCRCLPSTLEVMLPDHQGRRLNRVSIIGSFALFAGPEFEASGAVGATVLFVKDDKVLLTRDLVLGRHYSDARDLRALYRLNGDSTMVETLGTVNSIHGELRVDCLSIDVPGGADPDTLVFRDLNTPASFLIYDVTFEFAEAAVCPFKGHGRQIALYEVGAILRMRDRHRLDVAIHQLCAGLRACVGDLDEARGLGLTFIAAVVSATLEMGAQRSVHKALLESARQLEGCATIDEIVAETVARIYRLTDELIERNAVANSPLIDQALKIVDRNFAGNLKDEFVAHELGLSTSHFRHLFREVTNQPFHRYMVTLKLEKARELLLQSDLPVARIAESVGFQSPAHFSRAFDKRFGMAPSALRETRR